MSMNTDPIFLRENQRRAETFAADPAGKTVRVRFTDAALAVYLYDGDEHIQTQMLPIPTRWQQHGRPSPAAIRRYVRQHATIGHARIASLDW